ncbi:hypothetical protein SLS56_001867 [Neofusicoccum ribis]|uniref:MARVEL domain-containing protein n=1 Tax=Neofusicoccum ribis TaxID=45134 RepID=A0ABR3T6H1_9PEZI
MMLNLANGVARGFQIICAAVVLGLSINLIRTQVYGSVAAVNYAAFTGGFGLLAGLLGIAAIFIEPLAGLVMAVVDAMATLFLLAGGIAIAVKLRTVSCSSDSDLNQYNLVRNELTNGGCVKNNKGQTSTCGFGDTDDLLSRCKKTSADAAFMIIAAVFCIGTVAMMLLAMKRGGGIGRKGVVV